MKYTAFYGSTKVFTFRARSIIAAHRRAHDFGVMLTHLVREDGREFTIN